MTKTKIQSHKWLKSGVSVRPQRTLFIWIMLSVRRWWRWWRRQQHRLCMIYSIYWIWRSGHCTNVNNVPNQQIHSTYTYRFVRMISPIEISSRFICVHSFAQNNLMLSKNKYQIFLYNLNTAISNIQPKRINKQFKFSSFKCAYLIDKKILKNDHINEKKNK